MITVAFTNYNRTDLLFEAIEPFLNDDRVSEIVISDDYSAMDVYQTIIWKYNGIEKIKIYRNEKNLDCYLNKANAIKLSTNEWVCILDSDNIFDKTFIDAIFSQSPWRKNFAYAPEFARPYFDFRLLAGTGISRNNIASVINNGNCSTMLNAMNYFVNRDEYLKVFDSSMTPVTSDSLYQNCNWIKAGNSIYVVPGLQYNHRVHDGSHYKQKIRFTPRGLHESLLDDLKQMQ